MTDLIHLFTAATGPSRELSRSRNAELGMILAVASMGALGVPMPRRREPPPRKIVVPKKSKRAKVKAARKSNLKARQS